jgi:hypothetical protein
MVPFGGVGVMLLGALASGGVLAVLGVALARRCGPVTGWSWAGLLWSLVLIALVTLVPAQGAPGVVPLGEAQTACSFDYGGPAPEGFWILSGGQRLLNTLLFVPSGALVALALARGRSARVLAPLGLLALAAYSLGIEGAQLALARIDRACDVTDVVDNTVGAVLGFGAGLLLVGLLPPWRHVRPRQRRGGA